MSLLVRRSANIATIIAAFIAFAILLVLNSCNSKPEEETLYLGLKRPGNTPQLFAPGIISVDSSLEIQAALSVDKAEFYFTRQLKGERPKNLGYKFENNEWQPFMEAPYSGEMTLSTDGNIMHLGNSYRERTADGWSEEQPMDAPYQDINIMRLSSSSTGTYIFDERDSIGTLRWSRLKDGFRQEPEALEGVFKEGTYISHPFIAADESYIIWDCEKPGGYGSSDLYISFKQENGSWGKAINLGEAINSDMEDAFGSVSPDGKYFFFHRIRLGDTFEDSTANIYWVDAQVIMDLKE